EFRLLRQKRNSVRAQGSFPDFSQKTGKNLRKVWKASLRPHRISFLPQKTEPLLIKQTEIFQSMKTGRMLYCRFRVGKKSMNGKVISLLMNYQPSKIQKKVILRQRIIK